MDGVDGAFIMNDLPTYSEPVHSRPQVDDTEVPVGCVFVAFCSGLGAAEES